MRPTDIIFLAGGIIALITIWAFIYVSTIATLASTSPEKSKRLWRIAHRIRVFGLIISVLLIGIAIFNILTDDRFFLWN